MDFHRDIISKCFCASSLNPMVYSQYFSSCSIQHEQTDFDILKFLLGSEAWVNKTKEMYSSLSLKAISFVLFRHTKGELYYIEIDLLISLGNF